MIIDCTTFFNEFDLLVLRLNYLKDSVDYFVIAEGTEGHSGIPKPLYLKEVLEKRELDLPYEKIIHVVVDDMPPIVNGNCWPRERHSRNKILSYLTHLKDDDIVMYSDMDEIPDKRFIGKTGTFPMPLCYYWLNVVGAYPEGVTPILWNGTFAFPYSVIKTTDFQTLRDTVAQHPKVHTGWAGWHFSYLGKDDFIRTKIKNSAHKENDNDTGVNFHLHRIQNFINGSRESLSEIPFDTAHLPDYLVNNREKFLRHIWRPA